MSYALVDPAIAAWAETHGLVLHTKFGERERRFCYTSSPEGECFQISIEPPQDATITINAWDIETIDDEELHQAWTVPIADVAQGLRAAFDQVEAWKRR